MLGWMKHKLESSLPREIAKTYPGNSAGKESACKAGDLGSISGFGKIPRRRERLPTPLFWPRGFHGLYSPRGHKESDMTERLSREDIVGGAEYA